MLRRSFISCLAIGLTLCTLNLTLGQKNFIKQDEVNNAALIYWQSFALLPNLDEQQTKLLMSCSSMYGPTIHLARESKEKNCLAFSKNATRVSG